MNNFEKLPEDRGYENFLAKQARIYQEFRSDIDDIQERGLVPNTPDYHGGYVICWRHDNAVVEKVREVAAKVSGWVDVMAYDSQNTAHTTINNMDSGVDFVFDRSKIERLIEVVDQVVPAINKPTIDFQEWLMNFDTVIAAGTADKNFFDAAKLIVDMGKKKELNLNMPWGSHISVSRFLERKAGDEVRDLVNFVENVKPIGISQMKVIEVCSTEYQKGVGLSFEVFKRYEL